ncbi:MAG TPA: TonB-dependent receptor [Desulfomonilaceae bacterium]|nr:TonB-dependent receptor [Desulfomonilaceae bacterium]
MNLTKPRTLVVCLVILVAFCVSEAAAWEYQLASFTDRQEDRANPLTTQQKVIQKVKPPKHIVKVKPQAFEAQQTSPFEMVAGCTLPSIRSGGWQIDAEAFFARTKGHVRFLRGAWQGGFTLASAQDVDINGDMKLPDHAILPSFSAMYRFRPQWGVRYSIMPLALESSGSTTSNFVFGNTNVTPGQSSRVKWERLYQRIGLVYDPIRTYTSRVTVFGDYVRIDDKLSAMQVGFTQGDTMNNDLNMAMAGMEIERCLKTTKTCNTLSWQCRAGVAFLDEAVGSDLSTGVKYSIPLNNGRWGFISGGYRYLTYKKKYSDARMFDTAMEGGYLQMGFVF